ncbi:MAG: hypothetical protein QG673_1172 [Pseudomonadota bacterium]|nr:hypothetical protein [Pseudomonadota bacterium]
MEHHECGNEEIFNKLSTMYIKNIQQYHSTNKVIETLVAKQLGLTMTSFRHKINLKTPIWKIIWKARNESYK